jgi:hypothetical protein
VRLLPIVEKLNAGGLKRVFGALELAGLDRAPAVLPAYFVVPIGADATANRSVGVHDQATTFSFGVVVMLAGKGNDQRTSDELADREEEVIQALVGWTPPGASRACDYSGSRMLSVSGSTVSWLVNFRTGRHIRKVTKP